MNENFKGMDPELAKGAMELIRNKKAELDNESIAATSALNEQISQAFAGTQATAMQSFIERINIALQNLYKYLDGNESNFASKFDEVIQSYVISDENISRSYTNTKIE